MIRVLQTEAFVRWLRGLRDARAKARIIARIDSAQRGNLGDARSLGGGITEMRIDVGVGYRVYFLNRGATVIVLLCGGGKPVQTTDIVRARRIAGELQED